MGVGVGEVCRMLSPNLSQPAPHGRPVSAVTRVGDDHLGGVSEFPSGLL